MGTNYYLKKIATEEELEQMHSLVRERQLEKLQEMLSNINKEIHICKCSYGWQTCFDHNWGEYWQPNRKSLEEWLSDPNYYIEDEYGTRFTSEEFWQMVDKRNASPKNEWTSASYRKWESEHNKTFYLTCNDDIDRCYKMFGIKTEHNDFEVDKLTFAVYSDFR